MLLFKLLERSTRQFVVNNLPHNITNEDLVENFDFKSTASLLILWFNWVQRLVPAKPRKVFRSREFEMNTLVHQRRPEIEKLLKDIEVGNDLGKYLSRGVRHGYVNLDHRKKNRRPDLDLMLSTWGIHHLHISQDIEVDGFVKRGSLLLFVIFDDDDAYIIDLMTHNDWAKKRVPQIVVHNWPDKEFFWEFQETDDLSRELNDEQRLNTRKKHVNSVVEIDGKTYVPAAAITPSGMSIHAVRWADRVINKLEDFAEIYDRDPMVIIRQLPEQHRWPENPDFSIQIDEKELYIFEKHAGLYLRLTY